jgi:flagellar capping protein FliD
MTTTSATSNTNFISALGAGSGIDSKALAKNLSDAEIKPQQDLINKKIEQSQNKISGYGAILAGMQIIQTSFKALENPSGVLVNKVDNTQSSALTVTAGANSSAGSHTIEVVKIAQAQRTFSGGFAASDTRINSGNAFSLQLSVNSGAPKTIRVPAIASNPVGIVAAINSSGSGLQASIVNTGDGTATPYKIIITGAAGAANAFSLTSDDGTGTGETQTLSFGAATSNGSIKVAGVDVTVTAGDSSAVVAGKVRSALATNSLITGTPGRSVTNLGNGQVRVNYAGSDGDVADITFSDAGSTGVTQNIPSRTSFTAGTSVPGVSFVNDSSQTAGDAQVKIDGLTINRSSNKITDAITGVTLNLMGQTTGPANINISNDSSGVKDKLTALVKSYNDLLSDITVLTGPVNTKDTTDIYSGSLQRDPNVSKIKISLRSLFVADSSSPGTNMKALRDIGVSLEKDGTLSLDEKIMNSALTGSISQVVTMLTADRENKSYIVPSARQGLAGDAIKKLTDMMGTSGLLATLKKGETKNTSNYKDKLTKLDERLTTLNDRYTKQFAAMDSMVGKTNSMKTSLKSSFEGLMATYTNK